MKDTLFFLYMFVLPFVIAMSADALWNYFKGCVRRVRSRRAARARLEAMKRREEYERRMFKYSDPHYYGN